MFNEEVAYYFDGSMVGLLSCVFRAFQFKELQVRLCLNDTAQHGLFADKIEVVNNEQHAERVWAALQKAFIFFVKTILFCLFIRIFRCLSAFI